jgi:hypothetical protein
MAADTKEPTLGNRPVEELVQIAAAGGGMQLYTRGRPTDELVRIAAAAAHGGSPIFFLDSSARTTDELVEIAAAGKGRVTFVDPRPRQD